MVFLLAGRPAQRPGKQSGCRDFQVLPQHDVGRFQIIGLHYRFRADAIMCGNAGQ
jgi:hypothetical protein